MKVSTPEMNLRGFRLCCADLTGLDKLLHLENIETNISWVFQAKRSLRPEDKRPFSLVSMLRDRQPRGLALQTDPVNAGPDYRQIIEAEAKLQGDNDRQDPASQCRLVAPGAAAEPSDEAEEGTEDA
ncbi:hypothetical protein NQZ68_007745 [Dissostichus eleginoides]|nr:hypothetical protein NQZ68_007745 [Dissostichus eleginoides]